jgi:hypothetical protein
MVQDPLVWVGEAFGLAYLVSVWRRYLAEPGSLRGFARSGTLPMPLRR